MAGQAHHFRQYADDAHEYSINRYTDEVNRLYGVMNIQLKDNDYLAGEYSIADMAAYPWVRPYKRQGQDLKEFPHLEAWYVRIHDRPAVAQGQGRQIRAIRSARPPAGLTRHGRLSGNLELCDCVVSR